MLPHTLTIGPLRVTSVLSIGPRARTPRSPGSRRGRCAALVTSELAVAASRRGQPAGSNVRLPPTVPTVRFTALKPARLKKKGSLRTPAKTLSRAVLGLEAGRVAGVAAQEDVVPGPAADLAVVSASQMMLYSAGGWRAEARAARGVEHVLHPVRQAEGRRHVPADRHDQVQVASCPATSTCTRRRCPPSAPRSWPDRPRGRRRAATRNSHRPRPGSRPAPRPVPGWELACLALLRQVFLEAAARIVRTSIARNTPGASGTD